MVTVHVVTVYVERWVITGDGACGDGVRTHARTHARTHTHTHTHAHARTHARTCTHPRTLPLPTHTYTQTLMQLFDRFTLSH